MGLNAVRKLILARSLLLILYFLFSLRYCVIMNTFALLRLVLLLAWCAADALRIEEATVSSGRRRGTPNCEQFRTCLVTSTMTCDCSGNRKCGAFASDSTLHEALKKKCPKN